MDLSGLELSRGKRVFSNDDDLDNHQDVRSLEQQDRSWSPQIEPEKLHVVTVEKGNDSPSRRAHRLNIITIRPLNFEVEQGKRRLATISHTSSGT